MSEYDHAPPIMKRSWPSRGCFVMEGENIFFYKQAELDKTCESVTKFLKPINADKVAAVPV